MDTSSNIRIIPVQAPHPHHPRSFANEDRTAQSLCRVCGLCCNGTLFSYVPLAASDVLASEPDARVELENGQFGLKQSCRYYRERLCSIYYGGRPQSCVKFQCGVLKAYSQNKLSLEDALEEIRTTVRRVDLLKTRMQAQTDAPARNLTERFKAWTAAQGGCYADWSPDHSAILQEYYELLSHLRRIFGELTAG